MELIAPPLVVQVTPVFVVPVTVSMNCWLAPPCSNGSCGDTDTDTVVVELTLKGSAFDFIPVRVFRIVIVLLPSVARSLDGTDAWALLPLSTVVGRDCPFHCTTHFPLKPDPLTLTVSPALPATALDGDTLLSTSLGTAAAGLTRRHKKTLRKPDRSKLVNREEQRFTVPP